MAQDIVSKIQAAAKANGVDPDVALRIAGVESSYRPRAKNPESSAKGLFQVTNDTWKDYGGKPGLQKNVDENIRIGMKIMSSNKDSMQKFLGREPLPSDIYAAHFFGPTGARAVMSGDPLAQVSSLVSKEVMRANPQLAGKTANEVLTGFKQKFDGAAKRYPTSEPMKTTTAVQGPRATQPKMDQEAGAAAPALSARDRIAGMGANYQAALAAMMLGEAADEDGEDDGNPAKEPEEKAYVAPVAKNALADMDFGPSSSPFDAMEPAVTPPGMKFPMQFAEGGTVGPINVSNVKQYQQPTLEDMAKEPSLSERIIDMLPSQVFGIQVPPEAYKNAALTGLGYAVGLGPAMKAYNQITGAGKVARSALDIYDASQGNFRSGPAPVVDMSTAYTPDSNLANRSGGGAPVVASSNNAPVVDMSTAYTPDSDLANRSGGGAPVVSSPTTGWDGGSSNDYSGTSFSDYGGVWANGGEVDRTKLSGIPSQGYAEGGTVADEYETFKSKFSDYKKLDPRAAEEAAFTSRNITVKTDPDNPDRAIPNKPRDQFGRAGQELLDFLEKTGKMPTVVESRRFPSGGYEGPAYQYIGSNDKDAGVVRFPSFKKDPYGSLVHELTHASDRAMLLGRSALLKRSNKGEEISPEDQRFLDGYTKLYKEPTKLPLNISDDDLTDRQKKYRTDDRELRAFGVGNMAQDPTEAGRYNQQDMGETLNPHVDPTMATEAAIMRELYLRSGAVRGRAEGSPPEGEYADPEAAFMAGSSDAPAPRVTDAQAALALLRGVGDLPYVVAGSPVDISNMIMSPFGKRTEEGSSDWLKKQATRFGIRPEDETDPTLAGLRMMGELGVSAINPSSVPRAVATGTEKAGQAARMLEDMTLGNARRGRIRDAAQRVPDDSAYAPLRERMEAQGNLAMAIKPVGGYFETNQVEGFIAGIGGSEIPAVQAFVDNQMHNYVAKLMGSPKDPLRKAIDEGRVPFLNTADGDGGGLDNFARLYGGDGRAIQRKRRYAGFPEEGYAQTEEGKKFESYIDWMIDPTAPSQMELSQLPPNLRKRAEAAIKERGIKDVDPTDSLVNIFGDTEIPTSFGTMIDPELSTRTALGMGATESLYSFFDKYRALNLRATKTMLEKMLTDTTLPDAHRLTPEQLSQMNLADASVAAKKLDTYLVRRADKDTFARVKEMPTTKIYESGERWLAPDDLSIEPDQRATVRVLGEKGGWCTREDCHINMYGTGENRLNILVNNEGRPQVQVTTTVPEDLSVGDWLNSLDNEDYDALVPKTGALNAALANDPRYLDFVRENQQPKAWEIQASSFEQGGIKNKFTEDQFNKVMDLVRQRGAKFDPNDGTIKQMESADSGRPLLKDLEFYFRPFSDGKNSYLDQKRALFSAAEERFKDTTISAPEFVQLMRDPKVAALFPDMNGINSTYAGVSPDAFVYPKGEELVPVVDFKRLPESTMGQVGKTPPQGFAKGGLVERSVYNHQKYL
jgi:hypothetical protein